jgi:ATP-binding cassette subfamily B protein
MTDLRDVVWPASRAVEALEAAARRAGLPVSPSGEIAPVWGASELAPAAFDEWVSASARWLGIEAEPVLIEYAEVEAFLRGAAPALVRVAPKGDVLVVMGRRGNRIEVLTPHLRLERVRLAELRNAVCAVLEEQAVPVTQSWLESLQLEPSTTRTMRDAFLREFLAKLPVARCYLLRVPAGASFLSQLRFEHVIRLMASAIFVHACQYGLMLGAWYTLGTGAFSGWIQRDWLIAWALLLLSAVPLQAAAAWLQAKMLVRLGTLLKRRLLTGTIRVEPDELRKEGAGQLLGRALASSSLETLAIGVGLTSVLALIEFVILAVVLAAGPGGLLQTAAFLAWAGLTLALGWQSYRAAQRFNRQRRDMTSDLVENMIGHRTRLAQQKPARWHDGEDEALDRYLRTSEQVDVKDAQVRLMPASWYVVGACTLLPTLLEIGNAASSLAIAVGGMLLGGGALARLSSGMEQLASAASVWSEVKPLYAAAATPQVQPSPVFVASHLLEADQAAVDERGAELPLIDASDLVFGYPARPQPVLRGGSLRVELGDRILLEGPSGGGKSTLVSILSGLRRPQSGLLLLEGLDWQTVGPEGWRRRIAAAPQYHENHVFTETFLFNLLIGRRWPPTEADIVEAEEVCEALGLGDVLRRMPSGMMQTIGESGWRLSHGEQSRLFIARALLQNAKVIVLDESFAALDPKTVEQCLACVFERAPALLVVAHP